MNDLKTCRVLFIFMFLFFTAMAISPWCSATETNIGSSEKELPVFQIMTEDWVPYQFENKGRLEGIAVDLMVLLLKTIGSRQGRNDIIMYPWARGYDMLLNKENTILFSMTRTQEREHLFKWVGPIFTNSTYLIALKKKNFKIDPTETLFQYRIGTIIKDASELFVTRLGIPLEKLQRNTNSINNVKKLASNRIDFIVSGWNALENDARILGLDPALFETVYELDRSTICYAFNKNTPDWIIEKFQTTLNLLVEQGKMAELNKKYKHLIHE